MRILCDACESAAAIVFCAADEAALCCSCDQNVHMCNKLASRHVRVGLADPTNAPTCDICENAPAFFYCEIDGSSLCLQCDMVVHVGGKRTHKRFLLLRQRIEFPGDKPKKANREKVSLVRSQESNPNGDHDMIDLNSNPQRVHEPGVESLKSDHRYTRSSKNLVSMQEHLVSHVTDNNISQETPDTKTLLR